MTSPFVPLYRQFPTDDSHNLEKQLVNFHQQSNEAINQRTIGLFQFHVSGTNDSLPNGERWPPTGTNQRVSDGFRLVVQVSDSVLTVAHNIPMINQATKLYGAFYDGTSWWPLPYVDVVNATNQINISVTSTNIVVTKGGGAPPTISKGIVVFEYL